VSNNTKKYAAIGYVVSKVIFPLARKQAKKTAKKKARSTAAAVSTTAHEKPIHTGLLVGATIGAIGWLISRRFHEDDLDA
jgi:hypothetical protein